MISIFQKDTSSLKNQKKESTMNMHSSIMEKSLLIKIQA